MAGGAGRLWRRIRRSLSRTHDRDLRDELQLHLDLLTEQHVARGLPPHEAQIRARRELGNPARAVDASRDLLTFRLIDGLRDDVTAAVREARHNPGFTAIAVASLAVGIGAATTTASVVDALLLRDLPVHEPDRLVAISRTGDQDWSRWSYGSYRHFDQWSATPDAPFETAAVYALSELEQPLLPSTEGQAHRPVQVSLVSGGYFDVVGIEVAAGRALSRDDDRIPGAHPVAVISESFRDRHFAGIASVVGRGLELSGSTYEVVGVAAAPFTGEWVGQPTDVWLPLAMHGAITRRGTASLREDSPSRWLRLLARLKTDASEAEATAAAELVWRRYVGSASPALSERIAQASVVLRNAAGGYAPLRSDYARPLAIIAGIVGITLIVACVNFANLLFGRWRMRRQALAVRWMLGSGRWRIFRSALVEASVLALAAAALGLLAAAWATAGALRRVVAPLRPVDLYLRLDPASLAVAAGCVLTVVAFGLLPYFRWSWTPGTGLVGATLAAPRRNLTGRLFLTGQLALCIVLLLGTGLMMRTLHNLRSQELGFDPRTLLVTLSLTHADLSDAAATMLLNRVLRELPAGTDIQSVSASGAPPMGDGAYWIDSTPLSVDGRPAADDFAWTSAAVGAEFFEAAGVALVRGREFTAGDLHAGSNVAIINQSLARRLFGSGDPLNRRIGLSPASDPVVIGVVDDARQTSPRDRGLPVIYLPLVEVPARVLLVVRTAGDAGGHTNVVLHRLAAIAPDLPVLRVETVAQALDRGIGHERLLGTLAAWLGILTIAVSGFGLYALMATDVVERNHEFGIRAALGATRARIVRQVLADGGVVAAVAVALGLPLGLAALQPLSATLYQIQAADPVTVVVVVFVVLLTAGLAVARPARAASRVDPAVLLRG